MTKIVNLSRTFLNEWKISYQTFTLKRLLARGSKETKRFAVKDIQRMENGVSFADDRLTVTLRLVTRQVNLEFEDQSTRDAFVEAFTWLLKNSRAGTLM